MLRRFDDHDDDRGRNDCEHTPELSVLDTSHLLRPPGIRENNITIRNFGFPTPDVKMNNLAQFVDAVRAVPGVERKCNFPIFSRASSTTWWVIG